MRNTGLSRLSSEGVVLRGGRMTKHKGRVASFAPTAGCVLSGVSVLALGAAISISGSGAEAGECTGGPLVYTCSGGAAVGGGAGVVVRPFVGDLSFTTTPGFEMDVTVPGQSAINIDADGITFRDDNASSISTSANGRHGIRTYAEGGNGTSITLTGDVSGQLNGIDAHNGYSSDPLEITISNGGTVSGATGDGINAYNRRNDTGISITTSAIGMAPAAGLISGQRRGIYAVNYYTNSSIEIDVADVMGTTREGIYARNYYAGTDITIKTTGTVSGGTNGIRALNSEGTGSVSITVSGDVQGGSGEGIRIGARSGSYNTITLESGASVSSVSDPEAIQTGAGNDTLTIQSGATVTGNVDNAAGAFTATLASGATLTGDIDDGVGNANVTISGDWSGGARLGGGNDKFTLNGTNLTTITSLDGGADAGDVLTFAGGTSGTVGGAVTNWETIDVQSGSTLRFASSVSATLTTIQSGAAIEAFGGTTRFNGNVTNNGLINLSNGSVGDRVEIAGDFSGTGRLSFDVDYANNSADTLFIAGNASGATTIEVNDVSSGTANGFDVVLVQVNGTTAPGAFVFSGPTSFEVGAYSYEFNIVGNTVVLSGELGSAGAAFGVAGSVLGGSFNDLPTLRERVGLRGQSEGQPTWVRFYGDTAKRDYTTGTMSDSDFWGMQAGADFALEPGDLGQWVLGVTAQYGTLSATTSSETNPATGGIDSTGYGLGATATFYSNRGGYVDAQVQANWVDTDISSSVLGELASGQSSTLLAASVELGQRFALNENSSIVPQFQFSWGSVDTGSFTDSQGSEIDMGTQEAASGRFGVAYEYAIDDRFQAYVVGSLIRDFVDDGATVTVAGTPLSNATLNNKRAEIGIGGEMILRNNISLYGEAAYSTGIGGQSDATNENINGTIGVRFTF